MEKPNCVITDWFRHLIFVLEIVHTMLDHMITTPLLWRAQWKTLVVDYANTVPMGYI